LPIGAATTLTGRGTGNYIAFSVAAFGPASTDDGIYALYAYAGATANVTFRNAKLFVNKIPARG